MEENGPVKRLDEKIADLEQDLRDHIRGNEKFGESIWTALRDLRDTIDRVRTDHVAREEFQVLNARVVESSGARTTLISVSAVIVTIFVGFLFYVLNNQLTSADVSTQIQKEAPWNRDKAEFTRRLVSLEQELQRLQLKLDTHVAQGANGR